MNGFLVVSLLSLLSLAAVPLGQQVPQGTVSRTVDGNYLFAWTSLDGKAHSLLLVIGDKVVPAATVIVTLDAESQCVYEYTVSNGPGALQALYMFRIMVEFPVQIVASPPRWQANELSSRARVYWYLNSGGGDRWGIPPGGSEGVFTITSPNLPAVTDLQAEGAVPARAADGEMPQELDSKFRELVQAAPRTTRTIGPRIAVAEGESVGSLLVRIQDAYGAELTASRHPAGERVMALISSASLLFQESRLREASERLDDAISLLSQPAGGVWRDQLSMGLRTALRFVTRRVLGEQALK